MKWTVETALLYIRAYLIEETSTYVKVKGGNLSLRQCGALDYLARSRQVIVMEDL